MTTTARVLADSANSNGDRLTTLEVTFPRFILAEFNTHRVFSRNSASSRAIPVAKQITNVMNDPFVPKKFPVNQKGMSASTYYVPGEVGYSMSQDVWLRARDQAVVATRTLTGHELDVHKQIASRLLEPFMWHTVIVSSTEWDNFWTLRISEFAQPEIKEAAEEMKAAMDASAPQQLDPGEWHLPLVDRVEIMELSTEQAIMSSVARCAAVSYDRHLERDYDKEKSRYELLARNGHFSPFEHVATPSVDPDEWANFQGWRQSRWRIERYGA